MRAAICYFSHYGNTKQYAEQLAQATKLPLVDIKHDTIDFDWYDVLIIGSPIYNYKLGAEEWLMTHENRLQDKTVMIFTITQSETIEASTFKPELKLFYLRGKHVPQEMTFKHRLGLITAAISDKVDHEAVHKHFKFIDKSTIEPIIAHINELQIQSRKAAGDYIVINH
ncbi:flavodoxin family protein [Psychroserpens sp.]|uniref:flavodoxin family protein n=1 Tax=Psychroserpens sp. TaxID=2020870 RepID=UPI001B130E9F|nr:flavodoxin domain-containing protein [Psychroserpens sp.]MBO6606250.1 hypothetical protein [Psychroserpens sp.]MBO6630942.1 hypothetical protein [Psychroserpens sp.]MBO6652378.1 hypothetical protein [Psychroserpens sp.]MBO6681850.1 hypothetical protein [Psychroserpens sp.]MBO6749625.1 hypothetical protein [Psychroserpens sp.]